jgi:hypothetical protein
MATYDALLIVTNYVEIVPNKAKSSPIRFKLLHIHNKLRQFMQKAKLYQCIIMDYHVEFEVFPTRRRAWTVPKRRIQVISRDKQAHCSKAGDKRRGRTTPLAPR